MDIKKIEELINVLEGSRAEEISVSKGDATVHIRKGYKPKSAAKAKRKEMAVDKQGIAIEAVTVNERLILAPMVGLFHSENGMTHEGKSIAAGQIMGTIESMKLLNDVISEIGGTVIEVMVEDGMPVEYGQPLYRITPE